VLDQKVYAAYAKTKSVRFQGSSGGLFGVLAKYAISQGYTVFGAGFDENLRLQCIPAESEADLEKLMKSKYLQSNLVPMYRRIRTDLQQGRKIMFVSSPCQVAALKQYLGREYDNLLTVDFLCHGVPSQLFFDQCREYEEKKYKVKTLDYMFRAKKPNGSTPHYFTVTVEKKGRVRKITAPYFRSTFYGFFQRYISLRESCYDCVFSEQKRVSDITIGDFHTIERYVQNINRMDGVSTVVINTEKGKSYFEYIKDEIWYQEFALEKLIKDGVLFAEKTKRPQGRDAFIKSYETLPFDLFVKQNTPWKKYLIYSVYYHLPKCVRRIVKRLCGIE